MRLKTRHIASFAPVVLGALCGAWSLTASDAVASPSGAAVEHADPLSLYGQEISFDVFRDGKKVGYHRVEFDAAGQDLIVSSAFRLEIDILFFNAYRYLYRSKGRWRDGQLVDLKATVDDNGDTTSIQAALKEGRIIIDEEPRPLSVTSALYPTTHWNAGVLSQTQVLNTLTGGINNVRIRPQGRESVSTERGEVQSTRYSYSGELQTDVWYDDAGRWVKMRFEGPDGSIIDYVCRRCQGPAEHQAMQ